MNVWHIHPSFLMFRMLLLCRLRVICFPSAGNAEDMYTSEGTGARRAVSPLLVSWNMFASREVILCTCRFLNLYLQGMLDEFEQPQRSRLEGNHSQNKLDGSNKLCFRLKDKARKNPPKGPDAADDQNGKIKWSHLPWLWFWTSRSQVAY